MMKSTQILTLMKLDETWFLHSVYWSVCP